MTNHGLLLAASVIAPVTGLVAWTWWALARVEAALSTFNGFEGLHFDI